MSSRLPKRLRLGVSHEQPTEPAEQLSQSLLPQGSASDNQANLHSPATIQESTTNANRQRKQTRSKTVLDMLRKSASTIPSLGSAVDSLADCFESLSVCGENRRDFEELASSIATALQGLETRASQLAPAQMTDTVKNVIKELNQEVENISRKQTHERTTRYLNAEQDADDLVACYRRVDALFRQLLSDAILSVWRITNDTLTMTKEGLGVAHKTLVESRLAKLSPVLGARFDSDVALQVKRTGCTPNTRQLVLQGLRSWASDPHGARIYWMNGMAGTGKTTIAYTFCTELEKAHQLAGSFFCSRSLPECRDVTRIVPTIAYQLARGCQIYQEALCRVLDSDPDLGRRGVSSQLEKLMHDPLVQVKHEVPDGLLVVVIDALDECSDRSDAMLILEALLRFSQELAIKFFVTCRPDSSLLKKVAPGERLSRSLYHLHDIEQSLVQADIETYFTAQLEAFDKEDGLIGRLTELSGRLFIHAATTVKYIGVNNPSIDHRKRIDILLGTGLGTSRKAYEALDKLYTAILCSSLEDDDLEDWDVDVIRRVLHTVVCVREPLTLAALAHVIGLKRVEQAKHAVESLQSVLHVSEQSGLVSTLHASFPDYMHSSTRSGRFFCDKRTHSELLARRCFETMKEMLQFNICEFESSFVLDKDVSDLSARVSKAIPLHLFYVCRYWTDHMLLAKEEKTLPTLLGGFLQRHVLFWMEVMNVKHATRAAVSMLSGCQTWMKIVGISDYLRELCSDAQKFVAMIGANPVCKSTPHIYVSVLALWDKRAPIWTYYGARTQGVVAAEGPAIENREPAALAVWRYTGLIAGIAVSSDGKHVSSYSMDKSICIWDAHSGDILVRRLDKSMGFSHCVAFSPDGVCFASGLDDGEIVIWDTLTGRKVKGPLQGHTNTVRSVAYSPDGSRLASGSDDDTILIWNMLTGEVVAGPLRGHTSNVKSVAYSPDGKHVASGSWDSTICIWDTQTGQMLVGPITGHTDRVYSVAYSPDGGRIASGSHDRTVRIWDARMGDTLMTPFHGHNGAVLCVSYSPGGDQIVSGSSDGTVRVWDTRNGQTIAGPFSGHNSWVSSVVFMPDGNRVVSCADDQTIRIWDAKALHVSTTTSAGHTGPVSSIAFSPDSRYLVSASNDATIFIWDSRTSKIKTGPFTGHTRPVTSVAFSPCGDRVVSGSVDCTVRIWDVETGILLVEPCKGHSDMVNSVVFSPDGSRVASGSEDCTIRVWDVQSGHAVLPPFTRYTSRVLSVAYSPDGKHIASSCPEDDTIRIWDAQTGEVVAEQFHHDASSATYSSDGSRILFDSDSAVSICNALTGRVTTGPCKGHTDYISSVALSSDDCYIVTGSDDCTIRIWDAYTGQMIASPLHAHTGEVDSVACSPNGYLMASGSDDGAIRIWDFHKLISTAPQNLSWWTMNKDGWVVGHDLSLLLWVPPDLRVGLKWSQNIAVIHGGGDCELNFTNTYIGTNWTKCYIS